MTRKSEPSFEMKKIIWEVAGKVGRDNFQAIQRQVDYEVAKARINLEITEDVPNIRKIKSVLGEIDDLQPEIIIAELPKSVWRLRSDYRSLQVRSFSPNQKEHFNNITSFIQNFISDFNFAVPTVYDLVLETDLKFLLPTYKNYVPEYIREHLSQHPIWNDYTTWYDEVKQYVMNCIALQNEIREEGNRLKGIQKIMDHFELPIIRRISDMQLKEQPKYFNLFIIPSQMAREKLLHDIVDVVYSGEAIDRKQDRLCVGELLIAWTPMEMLYLAELNTKVSNFEEGRSYIDEYIQLGKSVEESEDVHKLISLFEVINSLSNKISQSMIEILNSRDYYDSVCRFCPE